MTGSGRAVVLRTPRLVVTTWLENDLDELAALHADPQVMRHLVSGVQSREHTRQRLRTWRGEHEARGWSKWRVAQHGRLVGRAGFGTAHGTGHRELGYVLAPALWGQGHATELAQALLDWHVAYPAAGVAAQVTAYVDPANAASRRVLAKCGFVESGDDDCRPAHLVLTWTHAGR